MTGGQRLAEDGLGLDVVAGAFTTGPTTHALGEQLEERAQLTDVSSQRPLCAGQRAQDRSQGPELAIDRLFVASEEARVDSPEPVQAPEQRSQLVPLLGKERVRVLERVQERI